MIADILWPVGRHILVCAILLLTMWEPARKTQKAAGRQDEKKGDWIDAEYEEIP